MKKYNLKDKKTISLIFCISILFLFTFNVTSSRYMGELKGEADDVVAIPVLSLDNPTFNYTLENMLPGDVDESDFYVNNYNEENTNEVLMKYYLTLKVDTEIPVKVTLTSDDGTEITLNEGKTDEYELPYDQGEVRKKFHIKVDWDKADNSYEYAGKNIKLTVDLEATQVVEG